MSKENFGQFKEIPPVDEKLEVQFKSREFIDVPGGQVEVLDMSPEEITHPTPVVYISGYGDGSPEGRKANIFEIAKEGRRGIMIKSPHGVEGKAVDEESDVFARTLLKQVDALIPVLDQKNIPKVSVLGESRGGLVAVIAAYLYPEKFENLVLIDSAGMTESVHAAKLTLRFIAAGLSEGKIFQKRDKAGEVSSTSKEQVEWGTKNFVKWIVGDVKLSTEEIVDMAKTEVYQLLTEIKKHGVGISMIQGVDDKVFRPLDVQKTVGGEVRKVKEKMTDEGAEDLSSASEHVVDGFYSVQGGHGDINTKPEQYTRAALKALEALERKHKKSADNNQ